MSVSLTGNAFQLSLLCTCDCVILSSVQDDMYMAAAGLSYKILQLAAFCHFSYWYMSEFGKCYSHLVGRSFPARKYIGFFAGGELQARL